MVFLSPATLPPTCCSRKLVTPEGSIVGQDKVGCWERTELQHQPARPAVGDKILKASRFPFNGQVFMMTAQVLLVPLRADEEAGVLIRTLSQTA